MMSGASIVSSLVLASASPRRSDLLAAITSDFTVAPADIDESVRRNASPHIEVERLARTKAAVSAQHRPQCFVLAADTLVSLDGVLLGKPAGEVDARRMLRSLSGRSHKVTTGVALACPHRPESDTLPTTISEVVQTVVWMRHLSDAEIERAIERGSPFDKAGGYGIQDEDFRPVATIEGCYCNVIGLPLWSAHRLLLGHGIPVQSPDEKGAHCRECPIRFSFG